MRKLEQKAATVLILSLIFMFLCSSRSFSQGEPAKSPVFVSPIKYLNQNEKGRSNWCVIYSIAMMLSHYDIDEKPASIAGKLKMFSRQDPYFSWKSTFADEGSLEDYLRDEHGLEVKKKIFVTMREETVEWIKESISANHPVLALYGKWEGHAIVLVGYDSEYLYINDSSGAFFYEAREALERDMQPEKWLREDRASKYEGAAVKWKDFNNFIRKRNLWGYLFVVTGKTEKGKNSRSTVINVKPIVDPDKNMERVYPGQGENLFRALFD